MDKSGTWHTKGWEPLVLRIVKVYPQIYVIFMSVPDVFQREVDIFDPNVSFDNFPRDVQMCIQID